MEDDERSSDCMCNCNCSCHDNGVDEASSTTHVLGSVNHSVDLYVSTPSKTKWIFVEEKIDDGRATTE